MFKFMKNAILYYVPVIYYEIPSIKVDVSKNVDITGYFSYN